MLAIKSVRLDSVDIILEGDKYNSSGKYSLITEQDTVLCKQEYNVYSSSVKVDFSADTMKAQKVFLDAVKSDIMGVIGF